MVQNLRFRESILSFLTLLTLLYQNRNPSCWRNLQVQRNQSNNLFLTLLPVIETPLVNVTVSFVPEPKSVLEKSEVQRNQVSHSSAVSLHYKEYTIKKKKPTPAMTLLIRTLPVPTLLAHACPQHVHSGPACTLRSFVARLVRTRPSDLVMRPDTSLTIFPTRSTQCIRVV